MRNYSKYYITMEGVNPRLASRIIGFLKTAEKLCAIGASRELHLYVDGDGSDRVKFKFEAEFEDGKTRHTHIKGSVNKFISLDQDDPTFGSFS